MARRDEIGVAYQAEGPSSVYELAFLAGQTALVGVLHRDNHDSQVVRIGGTAPDFDGFEVPLERRRGDGATIRHIPSKDPESVEVNVLAKSYRVVTALLDERCTDDEVRATFKFDLLEGRANACIDHFCAIDARPAGETSWHGHSQPVDPGDDRTAATDWIRVTNDPWQSREDQEAHPYEAVLVLSRGARARIHALTSETRDPP